MGVILAIPSTVNRYRALDPLLMLYFVHFFVEGTFRDKWLTPKTQLYGVVAESFFDERHGCHLGYSFN
ncbi:hypothetical protein BD770DRAFT_478023, partial [Pilaira anomala]